MFFIDCDFSNYSKLFKSIADKTYFVLNLSGDAAAEVSIVDKERIREVNKRTRGIDAPTDVLSYPMLDKITDFTVDNYPYDFNNEINAVYVGCILICDDIAAEQAVEYGHSFSRELGYLFLHGLLHVLGYDHIDDKDKEVMRKLEEQIMEEVKLKRD